MYVNAPRYLLRKYCALKLLQDIPRGKILEVGCGAGDLYETVTKLGYDITGIDYSQEAVALARQRLSENLDKERINIECKTLDEIEETFDIIFAFEVLEHIKEDKEALSRMNQLLKQNGYLLISVPAHSRWFGPSDRSVGHFRRYDKKTFLELLEQCQFKVEDCWTYGFPLANLTEFLRNIIYAKKELRDQEEGSKQSGTERSIEARFKFLYNNIFLYPFYLVQMLFIYTNLGPGYIVKAIRKQIK